MNLATIALRAVVDALQNDEDAARAALVALLALPDALGTIARSAAPVGDRDTKPTKTTKRPAARRREARPARPAPAAAIDAAQLVARLVEIHGGDVDAASKAGDFTPSALRAFLAGGPMTPEDVEEIKGEIAKAEGPKAEPDAAALVRAIEERHGLDGACSRFGFQSPLVLRRWAAGGPCSPRSLERLRVAAATAPYSRATSTSTAEPKGSEVDAAPEAALHETVAAAD